MSEQNSERPERSNSDRPAWKKGSEGRSERPGGDRPRRDDARPRRDGDRDSRPSRETRSDRDSRPSRDGGAPRGRFGDDRPKRERPGRAGEGREGKPRPEWETRVARPPREDREKSPMIPEEITDKDLDLLVRVQMKTLSPENAERVARHLAMVNLLINDDPELAHRHAVAASERAARIPVVRETVGLTAYTIGDFALALREMQAYRRLSGNEDQLPIMVDCERGLNRPEKALELGRSVPREKLEAGVRVNLAIAMSGARLDLNQNEMALAELEIPELNPEKVFDYSPHLFRAYADTLEILGRDAEAKRWATLADRAVKALGAKNAPAFEVQNIVEEITIPEPYEARAPREPRGDRSYGDRPQRSYGDRPQRSYGDRPDRGSRDDRGDRPTRGFGDRPDRGARPQRDGDDRPRTPRAPSEGSVDSTGEKQVLRFGTRPRDEKPRGDRPERGSRPGRDDRGPRDDRGTRDDRGSRDSRPPREDRGSRGDSGPAAGDRPGWKKPDAE